MYIPIWLVILLIFGAIYFYFKRSGDNKPNTVEELWKRADYLKKSVMEKSMIASLEEMNDFENLREMIRAMETDSLRLRERYKYNQEKQKQVAQDWMNYANAIRQIKFASELLDTDMEKGAHDRFNERVKGSYASIWEITKRMEDELGKESHLKAVNDLLHP